MLPLSAKGEVEFHGHIICLTTSAIIFAEEQSGMNVPARLAHCALDGAMDMRLIIALLHSGIAHRDPRFTSGHAMALVDEHGFAAIEEIMTKALNVSLPFGKKKADDEGDDLGERTGQTDL
jgi:hypothetical protein